MKQFGVGERAPWGDFPRLIRNGPLGALQKEPEYVAAKGGDTLAAVDLVERLLTPEMVDEVRAVIGDERPMLVPVLAVEEAGNNKIPLAMAEALADRLGLGVELDIVQVEKVVRTGAGSDHRLAFNPTFSGPVKPGATYLVVDDTVTMGGTIASLRGYIENRGGKVLAAAAMTAHEGALDMAVKPAMLAGIANKHGDAMNAFWKETYGYGIDHLTQGEAGHLKAAPSVDAIRTRLVEARHAGIERIDESNTQAAARAGAQSGVSGDDEPTVAPAQTLGREQQALIEGASVEQSYQEALAGAVQAKHTQVERIEDKLESLIDQQQARLQRVQAQAPGLLSLPSTKRAWQGQQALQQARLNALHSRLEVVREIKDGMGVTGPRIDELATRKMRAENPGLASDWDTMREEGRKHLLAAREKEKERSQARPGEQQARGLSLGLNKSPK